MEYKATIVHRDAALLYGVEARAFPEGISDAWSTLEARFPPGPGRLFYGLTQFHEGAFRYFAAVVPPKSTSEPPSGFERLTLEGGAYARVKVPNWRERTGEFEQVFEFLIRRFEFKQGGYSVEFYRSQQEAHLMIPVLLPETCGVEGTAGGA